VRRDECGQLPAKLAHHRRLDRRPQLARLPGLRTVESLHEQSRYRRESAQYHGGVRVASGDDRDLRTRAGQDGQCLDRPRLRSRLRRVGDDPGKRAIEVQRDQGPRSPAVHGRNDIGDDIGIGHRPILRDGRAGTSSGVGLRDVTAADARQRRSD